MQRLFVVAIIYNSEIPGILRKEDPSCLTRFSGSAKSPLPALGAKLLNARCEDHEHTDFPVTITLPLLLMLHPNPNLCVCGFVSVKPTRPPPLPSCFLDPSPGEGNT